MTVFNADFADSVVGAIEAHPEQHNQSMWAQQNECGTTMCFAGWAVTLAGAKMVFYNVGQNGTLGAHYCTLPNGETRNIADYAAELLGLTEIQQEALFHNLNNDIDVVKDIVKDIANGGDGIVPGSTIYDEANGTNTSGLIEY